MVNAVVSLLALAAAVNAWPQFLQHEHKRQFPGTGAPSGFPTGLPSGTGFPGVPTGEYSWLYGHAWQTSAELFGPSEHPLLH